MLLCEISTWKDRLEKIVETLSDQVPSSTRNNDGSVYFLVNVSVYWVRDYTLAPSGMFSI